MPSPAASRSQISWKVISPCACTVTSTLGSARHSRPKSDGCQPPQTTGSSGRQALAKREARTASAIGPPVSTVTPRQRAPSRARARAASGSRSRRASTITTS